MGGSPHDVGVLTGRDALSLGDSRRLAVGPDGVLYFCDLDNSGSGASICTRRTGDIAGDGHCGYGGDRGAVVAGTLNIQHEIAFDARGHLYIAERDNHVIRTVSRETGALSTLAGTGVTGALVEITQVQAVKMVELFSHGAMTGIRGSANGSIDRRLPCSHSRDKI